MEQIIEHKQGEYVVYEIGEYESSSVLAGQTKKSFLDVDEDLAVIEGRYPKAKFVEGVFNANNSLPDCPPDWFDPMDAGEEW